MNQSTNHEKTQKLISRGSENPKVARAARQISEMLTRMSLGQATHFAEIVEQVFPNMTEKEASALADFFNSVGDYFSYKASGGTDRFYAGASPSNTVRSWKTDEEAFYDVHKVFCVLACELPYCAEHKQCWETRQAFCVGDAPFFTPTETQVNPDANF